MGREARRRAERNFRQLIATASAVTAEIRAALAVLGVAVDTRHTLAQQLTEVGWLIDQDVMRHVRDDLTEDEKRHTLTSALTVARLSHFASALAAFSRVRQNAAHLRWLRGDINTFDKRGNEALDHLLEIEIAGLLARRADVVVEMAEPDVVYEHAGVRIAVACKRPKSMKAIDPALRKAARQIEVSGIDGIALIDISLLLLPTVDAALAYNFPNEGTANELFERLTNEALVAGGSRLEEAMKSGLVGALHSAWVVYVDGGTSTVRASRKMRRSWNATIATSEDQVKQLVTLLS